MLISLTGMRLNSNNKKEYYYGDIISRVS